METIAELEQYRKVMQDIKEDEVFQAAAKSAQENYDPDKTIVAPRLSLDQLDFAYDHNGSFRCRDDIHYEKYMQQNPDSGMTFDEFKRIREVAQKELFSKIIREKGINI